MKKMENLISFDAKILDLKIKKLIKKYKERDSFCSEQIDKFEGTLCVDELILKRDIIGQVIDDLKEIIK